MDMGAGATSIPGCTRCTVALAELQGRGHGHGELHVHGVLADDRRQHPGPRADDVALGHGRAADPPVDRRPDLGVAEVDPGRAHLRGGREHEGLGRALAGQRRVEPGLRRRAGGLELARARQVGARVEQLGLGLRQRGPGDLEGGLERAALEAVEQVAARDLRALGEQALLEERLDPGHQVDAVDGAHAADELVSVGDRFGLDLDHAHGRGRRARRPGRGGRTAVVAPGDRGEGDGREQREGATHERGALLPGRLQGTVRARDRGGAGRPGPARPATGHGWRGGGSGGRLGRTRGGARGLA